jgi:hypothetical protein
MSGATSRRFRLACLAAVSTLAIAASGLGLPPVRDVDLVLGEHGRLHIGAIRTDRGLLGVAVAQVPTIQQGLGRALQGIGAGETVTLDDVTLDLGFATYRMPKVEFSGSSLARAELMSLFDKNASEPLAARVGRLSAKEIRVPELVVEQTFANQRQTTRYRNIVVAEVAKGRIASATSESGTMEMKGGKSPGSGTMGRLTVTDVDAAEAARIYAEKAAAPAAMKKLYGGFTLENLAIVPDDGPRFTIARIAGKDFAARPTRSSWMETMKAFESVENLDKASPAEQSRVFGAVADVFDSMEIGLVEATGIEIVPPKDKEKGSGRIARIAYSNAAGKPADMRLERFEIATEQGKAKIDLIAFTGFSLTGTFKGLRDLEQKPLKDIDMASLRQLIPTIGTIRISGVDFDVPDEKKGPTLENIKFSVKDVEVTADQPLNGIPTNLRVGVDAFRFVIPPNTTEDGLKELAAMGYKELDLSWLTAAAWNAATNELQLREVSVRGGNMGSASLRGTIGGVTKEVFSPDNAIALVSLLGATVRSADLRIENGGLVEKLLAKEAAKQKKSPDDLRKEFGMMAAVGIPALLGNSGQAKAIGQAVARFVAKPGKLSIAAKTKDAGGLGVADLALIGEPGAILDKLEVTATAE